MLDGRVLAIGPGNDGRQRRRLRQGQGRQILSEIGGSGFAESVDAERPALPHVSFIGVQREDLLLGQPLFQDERDDDFGNLTFVRSFRAAVNGQKEIARELLRDRARAANAFGIADTVDHCTNQAHRINSPVREEMLILGSNERTDEDFRQIVVLDESSFLTRLVIEICYKFGRQPHFGSVPSFRLCDLGKRRLSEFQTDGITLFRLDRNRIAFAFVSTIHVTALLGAFESSALKPRYYFVRGKLLAWINTKRCGVYLGRVFEDFAAKLAVDHPRIVVVVIKDEGRSPEEKEDKDRKKDFEKRRTEKVHELLPVRRLWFLRLTFSHGGSIALRQDWNGFINT